MSSTRLFAFIAAAALSATASASAQPVPVVTLSGSPYVAPLVAKLSAAYRAECRNCATFKLSPSGSDRGIADARSGRVSIGLSSRDPQSGDQGVLFTKFARDGVCIVTHPSNPIASLPLYKIQAIFSGQVSNWSDVPKAKARGDIVLVVRNPTSGPADAFQNIFMGPARKVDGDAEELTSSGLVQQLVAANPQAIGYLPIDALGGVNVVSYRRIACNFRNAKSGQYAGTRFFWFVTRSSPQGAAKTFVSWVRTSRTAQRIIASSWIPLR